MSVIKTARILASGEVQYATTATRPADNRREALIPLNADGTAVQTVAAAATTSSQFSTPGSLTDRSGTITSGGTAQTLAAANTARKYLFVENVSIGDLWINFTTTAVANQPSILIKANGSFVMEGTYISTEAVSIIGATTGQAFTAKEG